VRPEPIAEKQFTLIGTCHENIPSTIPETRGKHRDTPRHLALCPGQRFGLADPKIKARLADVAGPVLPGSPADFGNLIAEETEKWDRVIKLVGIRPK
jgi:hypothetical protein